MTDEVYARAKRAQPHFDERMRSLGGGGELVGIEHSLKSEKSYADKASRYAEEGRVPNDLNRYTFTFPKESYSAGVREKYEQLRADDFKPIPGTHRDTWDDPSYKGLNTAWRDNKEGSPTRGQPVEIQFHTPESFRAKEDNHRLYELSQDRQGARTAPRDYDEREYQEATRHLQAERYQGIEKPEGMEALHRAERGIEQRSRALQPVSEEAKETVRGDERAMRVAELDRQVDRSSQASDSRDSARERDGPDRGLQR